MRSHCEMESLGRFSGVAVTQYVNYRFRKRTRSQDKREPKKSQKSPIFLAPKAKIVVLLV